MSTPYEDIFARFLRRIEDRDLANMDESELSETLVGYLDAAIGYIELDDITIINSLSERDNDGQEFTNDLTNAEMEAVSMYMVAAWYEPKINAIEHLLMMIGTREERWTSQKEHMLMMIEARDNWLREARKYFLKYGLKHNKYLTKK